MQIADIAQDPQVRRRGGIGVLVSILIGLILFFSVHPEVRADIEPIGPDNQPLTQKEPKEMVFDATQTPAFLIHSSVTNQSDIKTAIFDANHKKLSIPLSISQNKTDNGFLVKLPPDQLQTGKLTLEADVTRGKTKQTVTQDFQWGPTTISPNDHYKPLLALRRDLPGNKDQYFTGNYEVTPGSQPIAATLANQPTAGSEVELVNAHPDLPKSENFKTEIKDTSEGQMVTAIPRSQEAKGGLYNIEAKNPTTGATITQVTVAWGVLAFNPDYAVYPVGSTAKLAMAVLDDRGKMICDADMTLEITDPAGKKETLSTDNQRILVNDSCFVHGVTPDPDYYGEYQTTMPGDYQVTLVAKFGNGSRTLHDHFSVKDNEPFYLQRQGTSRIYPPVDYQYSLNFEPKVSGRYEIKEKVPANFDVSHTDATVTTKNELKILTWQVNATADHDQALTFTFKGPNISPYLFTFGPAEVTQQGGSIWTEPRTWLIASDAAIQSNGTGGGNWSVGGSWAGGVAPGVNDTATILNGDTITLNASITTQAVTINNGGTLTNNGSLFTLTLTNTSGTLFTLGATGTFTPGTSIAVAMNPNASITTTSGTITFNTLSFLPTIATSSKTYTMGSGALTLNGNFGVGTLAASNALNLNVVMGANITVASTKTVTIGAASGTNTVKLLTNSASNTLSAGLIVVAAHGTLASTDATPTNVASTVILTGTSGTLFTKTGTFTQGTSEVQVTSASGNPTLLSAATTFHKLTINSVATIINAGAVVTINNAANAKLYIQSGVLNNDATGSFVGPGTGNGTFQIDSGGVFCLGGTTNATNATCDSGATQTTVRDMPTFQTYTFDPASTVYWETDVAQTSTDVISATPTYGNLEFRPLITAARTYTFATATTTINGNFTINANKAATTVAFTVNLGGATTLPATKIVTVKCQSTTAGPIFATGGNALTTGKLKLDQTIACPVVFQPGASVVTLNATSGVLLSRVGSTTFTTSTSEFDVTSASGPVTLLDTATTFDKLTINATGVTVNAGNVITMAADATDKLYIENGTLDDAGNSIVGTSTVGAAMVMDAGGTLNIGSAGTASTFPTNYTVDLITLNSGSTVVYQAGVNQTVSGVPTYSNLTVTPLSGTPIFSLGAATTVNGNFTINGGIVSDAGFAMTGPGAGTSKSFTIASGAKYCFGAATASCTTSSTNATSMPTFATYAFNAASTVVWMGNVNETISSTPSYGNLQFIPVVATAATTRTYTLGGAMTINGNWDIIPTAANTTDVLTVIPGGNITMLSTKTLTIKPGATNNPAANLFLRASGVDYNLTTGFIVLDSSGTGKGTLSATDSGAIAGAATITVNGSSGSLITSTSNGAFSESNSTVTVTSASGSPSLLSGALTFHILTINAPSATVINAGAAITTDSNSGNKFYIQNGVFNLEGQTITPGSSGTLQVDSTGTFCLGGTTTASNATCDSGATQTSASTFPAFNTITLDAASTVIYLANVAQTVPATVTYGNLKIQPVLTTDRAYTLGAAACGGMTVNGNFTINPSGTANTVTATENCAITLPATKTVTLRRSGSNALSNLTTGGFTVNSGFLDIETGGTLIANAAVITLNGTSGTLFTRNTTSPAGVFTQGTSEVKVTSASGTPTLLTNTVTFHKLTINAPSVSIVTGAALTINNAASAALTITAGTLDDNGSQITGPGSGNGTISIASGATYRTGDGSATTFPVFQTYSLNSTSTVVYDASTTQTIASAPTYGNLQLSIPSGTPTKTPDGNLIVAGNLTIDSGNTLDMDNTNNRSLTLGGNYTNNGTFTARAGTVTLNGTSAQTLSGTMTGSSAFYDLTVTNSSGTNASDCERTAYVASVIFGAAATSTHNYTIATASTRITYNSGSTYTFANISWNGQASGTKVYFRNSATSGTWLLKVTGTQTAVSYVNVSRSDASVAGGSQIVANNGTNTDCTNNTNWLFTGGNPTFTQAAYRFGNDLDSTSVDYTGAPAAGSALSVTSNSQKFRLRLLIAVGTANLAQSGQTFKLQFGSKPGGGCSAATYADVATGSGVIRYYDNATPSDGANLTGVAGDPTDGGNTVVNQTYEEANNFTNSTAVVNSGQDGMWDFSLINNSALGGSDYCFRAVKSDGTALDTYSVYPEVIINEVLSFSLDSSSKNFGTITPGSTTSDQTSTLTTSSNAASGYVITLWSTQPLTNQYSSTIANWTGTNASPTSLSGAGSSAFGYTTSDSSLGGGNRFSSGTLFAGFALTGPGDPVADNSTTPVTNDVFTITYRLRAGTTQQPGNYTTNVIYINTAAY